MREHLGVEFRLQLLSRLHDRSGISVLGFEVGDDLGRVLVAHPAVVVLQSLSVQCGWGRFLAGGWWGNGSGNNTLWHSKRAPADRIQPSAAWAGNLRRRLLHPR